MSWLILPWFGPRKSRKNKSSKKKRSGSTVWLNLERLEVRQLMTTVQLSSATYSVTEHHSPLEITVTLDAASNNTVTVNYSTSAGTATAGTDYENTSGTLTFDPDDTSESFYVQHYNDNLDEPNETINLSLSSPTNATLGSPSTGTLTINNDDSPPWVDFTSASQSQGENVGTMTVTALLSKQSGFDVTVPFTLSGTATGSGTDYTITSTPITIPAGQSSANITITVNNDTLDEDDETVIVTMGTPTNATQGSTTVHTATITDNDATPTVQFTAASQSANENAGTMTITAQLSAVSGRDVTVPFILDGTATYGSSYDYTIAANPITITAGNTTANITITLNNDSLDENNETVIAEIDAPTNATIGATSVHTATITDNDATPTVQFTAASQSASENAGTMTVTAQLSAVSGLDVTVPFTLSGTATEGSSDDYTITATPVAITAGNTTAIITITVDDDELDENNETVIVTMGTPTNATQGSTTVHTATITDNDATPTVTFDTASQNKDEDGIFMTIGATLSAPSGRDVTVPFTLSGTATEGGSADYTITYPIFIPAGQTTPTTYITINDDDLDEDNETIIVTMGTPTNATLGATTVHTATINDNDATPTVKFTKSAQSAPELIGTTTLVTAQLSAVSGRDVTVPFSVGGTATGGGTDYTITSSPIIITAGSSTGSATITAILDSLYEGPETVIVTMGSPTNANQGTPNVHTATIYDLYYDPWNPYQFPLGHVTVNVQTGNLQLVYLIGQPQGSNGNGGGIGNGNSGGMGNGNGGGGNHNCGCDASDQVLVPMMNPLPAAIADSVGTPEVDAGLSFEPILVYNSETADPRPIFSVSVETDPEASVPSSIDAQLTFDGNSQDAVNFSTTGGSAGSTYLIGLQVEDPVVDSGWYTWQIEVTIHYSGSDYVSTLAGGLPVQVNDGQFGAGWSLAGQDYLIDDGDSVLWVYGAGGASYFLSNGDGTYDSASYDNGALVKNGDNSYTYTLDGIETNFASNGKISTIVAPNNTTLTFTYSGSNLASVTEPNGDVAAFAANTITQPGSRVTTLTYGSGDLTRITNPDGGLRTLTYEDHKLTGDNDGTRQSVFVYDAETGTIAEAMGATITPRSMQGMNTASGNLANERNVARLQDALGNVTSYTLDNLGRLTGEVRPGGVPGPERTYNDEGKLASSVDALGNRTTYTYTEDGKLETYLGPNNQLYSLAYHATFGKVTRIVDPLGKVITFTYDAGNGELKTIQNALGGVFTYTYDDGLVQSVADPLGEVTTYVWDGRDLKALVNPEGERTTFGYDSAGNRVTAEDPSGTVTTLQYDAMGRMTGTIDPTGVIKSTLFDGAGNPRSTVDELGNRTTYTYNASGWLISVLDPLGNRTTTVYDLEGKATATVDQFGNRTSYHYDAVGRQIAVEDYLNKRTTSVYDNADRVIASIDQYGKATTFVYDSLSRQIATVDPFENRSTTIYDNAGRIEATVDPYNQRTTRVYDNTGQQIASIDAYGKLTTTVYDSAGRVQATVDPFNNRTSYVYDDAGRPN